MKTASFDRKQSGNEDTLTNTRTLNEVGILQDDLKRVQRTMNEDITEVKKDVYERISKDQISYK